MSSFILTCRTGDYRGRSWPIGEGGLRIGRTNACNIVLTDSSVSREHCVIILDGEVPRVTDLQSINGTLVNGHAVQSRQLEAGDELCIGDTRFLVCLQQENPVALTPVPDSEVFVLGETKSLLLRENVDAADLEGRPDTVLDLVNIARLGRDLSRAKTREDLLKALTKRLRRHISPLALHLQDASESLLVNELFVKRGYVPLPAEKRVALCARVASNPAEMEGVLEAVPRHPSPVWLAAAPMKMGEETIGVLSIELEAESAYTPERATEFLVACAVTAAPFMYAIERVQLLKTENRRLRAVTDESRIFVGESLKICQFKEQLIRAAQTDLRVLIIGETGTGKELAARILHDGSSRHEKKFISINCAAVSNDLFLSELFGHERGGFTGAEEQRSGFVELAHGGTLFLDEVTDLAPQNQAALLRFLETGKFYRVGGRDEVTADARVVSATNKDIDELVKSGAFRSDLLYRLCGMRLDVPPLREHPDDIPLLAEHFFDKALRNASRPLKGITDDGKEYLQRLEWRGNARELRSTIDRAVAFAVHEWINADDIERSIRQGGVLESIAGPCPLSLEGMERRYIEDVFKSCSGNVKAACDILGIGKTTLYEKLDKYGIKVKKAAPS